jgi:iron complex outermembrane receptor protein
MIDGRTVYSPLFSGVFWDAQNVMLEDLDRIEVISGPGGTLWGANAVNGIINIVSRPASETQGLLADLREGWVDRSVNVRFGGRIGDNAAYRVYAMGFERDHAFRLGGGSAQDGWENVQAGFRLDWAAGADTVTLQGDTYHGSVEQETGASNQDAIGGGNVMAKWSHALGEDSLLSAQFYYDNAWRNIPGTRARLETFDFDAQYRVVLGSHDVVVGGGYRNSRDSYDVTSVPTFLAPARRTLHLGNVFAQDSVALSDTLKLTFGLKLEDNSYTGLEFMPDVRLAWKISDTALLWGAVSRAVRTPSRADRDVFFVGVLQGGPQFESETVIAYELGYRGRPLSSLSLSVSAFYNVYDDLRSVESATPPDFPWIVENGMKGDGYGVEAWGTYEVFPWWRVSAGFSAMRKNLGFEPGSQDVLGLSYAGNDPEYQVSLRSAMNFGPDVAFDVFVRHVDSLPSPPVADYTEVSARLGWRVTDSLELAVVGADIADESHQEFSSPTLPSREIRRSIYFSAVWKS